MVAKKGNTKVSLDKVIAQDKKELAKHCNNGKEKYFKELQTLEDALISIFKDERMQQVLKTMTCACSSSATNAVTGEVKVTFIFSNDDCCEKDIEFHKKQDDIEKGLSSLVDLLKAARNK